jgi:hypothetical protein
MNMTPVNSSNIEAVGYEDGRLQVNFKSGSRYVYEDVPRHIADDFLAADSPGRFFVHFIKGVYKGRKV